MRSKRWWLAFAAIGWPVAGALWFGFTGHKHAAHRVGLALAVVAVVLVLAFGLLELAASRDTNAARKSLGYMQIVLGADGRFSTSKTIAAVWTLVLVAALSLLAGMVWFAGLSAQQAFGSNWNSYFLLLGGPFAAAVIAKGMTVQKLSKDPSAKSSTTTRSATALGNVAAPPGASPRASDVVSNDAGETDFVDTQYSLFALVAVAYFVGSLVKELVAYSHIANGDAGSIGLPQIPSALLGLTSAAALTYVGNKAVQP